MTNAVAAVTLSPQQFPQGTVAGGLVAALLDPTGKVVSQQTLTAAQLATTASATFQSVAPGTYTIAVARVDASGSMLGTKVTSDPFTITAPIPVTITVPSGCIVSIQ